MKQTATRFVVFCCTCFVAVVSGCRSDGPGSCSFWGNTCGWTTTSGWRFYYGWSTYFGLKANHNTTERIESRTACSTNNRVHCFEFEYMFDESDDVDLSVIIQAVGTGEKEVWTLSSSSSDHEEWKYACVPVNTTTDFTVIFEARSPNNHRVFIDDIDYEKDWCDIDPPTAIPPLKTSPTTQAASTATAAETTPASTSRPPTQPTTFPTSTTVSNGPHTTGVSDQTLHSTGPGRAPTTESQAREAAQARSSGSLGLIVGPVVAVVFLVVVGVVLFVLFKRKQTTMWKKCFRRQGPREEDVGVTAHHNAVYNQGVHDPDEVINVDISSVRPERAMQENSHYDTPAPPAENYYSVVDTATEGNDSEPLRFASTQANKPKIFNDRKFQHEHQDSVDDPYEIDDAGENIMTHPSAPYDSYNELNFYTRPERDNGDRFLTSTEQTSGYDHLTSHTTETPSAAADRDEGPAMYQNTPNGPDTLDHQPANALYQNVSSITDTQEHHHGTDGTVAARILGQDADLTKEVRSAGVYHLPQGTTSTKPLPFPKPGGAHECPDSESQEPTTGIYHVVQEHTLSEPYPQSSPTASSGVIGKTDEYQHLDFDGQRGVEERSDDVSLPVYSHLNEGCEDGYQKIDRDHRREVIDGDYSHV